MYTVFLIVNVRDVTFSLHKFFIEKDDERRKCQPEAAD